MIAVRVAAAGELDALLALRHAVFVVEQGVPLADELDGLDARAEHLVAHDGDALVGTCRLLPDGDTLRLGRMAVAAGARRRGVASALLAAADERARARGCTAIVLAAQADAVALYERVGYATTGEPFLDAGIEHVGMVKQLRA